MSQPLKMVPQNEVPISQPKKPAAPTGLNFRQTRHANELQQLVISIEGPSGQISSAALQNWSRTGIGFEMPRSARVLKNGETCKVRLRCGEIPVYDGDIKIKTVREIDGDKMFYGAAFASSLFLIETVNAALAVNACTEEVKSVTQLVQTVNPLFCQSVLALSAALRHMRLTCRAEEQRWNRLTFDQRSEAEQVFLPNIVMQLKNTFIRFNVAIAEQVDVESLSEDSIYHKIFHEEIYPYFEGADLVRRAYEKPRGYAGDFEMMNQIYRNGFEGNDLFGKILHHYITNENSAESVRFRKPYFYAYYQELLKTPGKKKVLSIACGPAVEMQEVVESWNQEQLNRIDVTLFDLDREALEHAQMKIFESAVRQGKEPQISFVNASVKSFLTSSAQMKSGFDLIYSGGLFDYLDNITSAALTRKFAAMLNPGGTLIIGNFTKNNLTKAFLHLLTSWTLIHKTEQEILGWAEDVEDCTVKTEFDTKQMNAFLVVRKNASG